MKTPAHTLVRKSACAVLALLLADGAVAHGARPIAPPESVAEQPALASDWEFNLALPSWLANTSGTVGVDGFNSGIYLGADTLIKNLDMIATFSAEVRKGRFGIYGDMLYVSASDGIGQNGLIEKVSVQLDQWLVDLELNYRVLEGPRGYLDLRAGVRYTNFYNQLGISPNDDLIDQASADLVDDIGQDVRKRLAEIDLRGKLRSALEGRIQDQIGGRLNGVTKDRPNFPIAPLGSKRGGRLDEVIREILDRRLGELADALRAERAAATQAIRERAQRRIDATKRRIANEVAEKLKKELDTTASLDEDWWDPYVGIRARFNLDKAWYFIGKADIGGFGISSQITWQGYIALGCQLTRTIYAEAGYRYLYTDYEKNNFLYKVTQSGAEITMGVIF